MAAVTYTPATYLPGVPNISHGGLYASSHGEYLLTSDSNSVYLNNVTIDSINAYNTEPYILGADYAGRRDVTATATLTIDNMINSAVDGLRYVMNNASPATARYTVYSDGTAILRDCWIRNTEVTATGETVIGLGGYQYTPNNYQGTAGFIGLSDCNNLYVYGTQTEKEKKLSALKSKLCILVKSRADMLTNIADNEQQAMQTLREVITETEFRKYIKYGFVLVKGKSGDTYQIFRNRSHTKVWRAGKIIEEVCVRIKNDIKAPPTDNVVAFKAMIENDEAAFKTLGNVYKFKEGRLQREDGNFNIVAGNVADYAVQLAA